MSLPELSPQNATPSEIIQHDQIRERLLEAIR